MAIDLTIEDGVALISLNRGPANAYDMAMLKELIDAVHRVRDDPAIRLAVSRSEMR